MRSGCFSEWLVAVLGLYDDVGDRVLVLDGGIRRGGGEGHSVARLIEIFLVAEPGGLPLAPWRLQEGNHEVEVVEA